MDKFDIKLLLVEDDVVTMSIYKRILGSLFSNILIATNGEEGFNLFQQETPDLILTDIKMPVMNGLDMINKIREENKTVRIIIMSAYGESRYFINAIESGVKGFLTKPIKNDHLKKVVIEQANDILLEQNLILEEKRRKIAETEREKSDKILNSLSIITATIFQEGLNESSITHALKQIGESTESSRVIIFKFDKLDCSEKISIQYVWRIKEYKDKKTRLTKESIKLNTPTVIRWFKLMKQKKTTGGNIKDFDPKTQQFFQKLGSKSLLLIPIFIIENLWGFIALDDFDNERVWSKNVEKAMQLVAYNLGAALYRRNVELELVHININLERRVIERTKELKLEVLERSTAQELLKESEEKYRLIYENASNGIILIQYERILLTNPTIVILMEAMPRDLIGKKFYSFIKSSNKKDIKKFFSSKKMHMTEKSFEVMISTKAVEDRWLEIKVNGIEWDGEPAFLVFASDVSSKKSAQIKLNDLNKNLEQKISHEINKVQKQHQLLIQKTKLESLGELSASLAHEINQPLGGISMGLENILYKLMQRELNDDYLNSKINVLFDDINRIKHIIEHVRTFSRDQQNASIEVLDVDKVARNAISLINRQYLNHQVELIVEIANGDYHTLGNPFRLEQVFLNILSNAKSAVEKKSKQDSSNYVKTIKLTMKKNDEFIFIYIKDNGIGMTAEVKDKIFDPFFTTKDQQSGTGLGLSISYGIIKEMNGEIKVESKLNSYTKLTVELPITNA